MLLRYQAAVQNLASEVHPQVPQRDTRHTQPFHQIETHTMSYTGPVQQHESQEEEEGEETEHRERCGVYHFAQSWCMQGHNNGVSGVLIQ